MTKTRAIAAGAAALAMAMAPIHAASAITEYDEPATQVEGETVVRSVTQPQTRVVGAEVTRPQELPVTGGDLLGLTALGAGALGAGFVLVRRSRRAD
jgi:LPXTG-motif cell wall-anchored protein